MRKLILLFLMLQFLTGCLSFSQPKDLIGFANVESVYEIDGVYKNRGTPRGFHLSELLWRWILKPSIHDEIDSVKIVSDDEKLIVKAIKKGYVLYEKVYVENRDFTIRDGKIYLQAFKLKRRPNDKYFGPSYQHEIFGLDLRGNIKYETKIYGVVLYRSLIPILAADFAEERFEKLQQKSVY